MGVFITTCSRHVGMGTSSHFMFKLKHLAQLYIEINLLFTSETYLETLIDDV